MIWQGKDGNKDDEHFAFVTHNTSDFSLPNGNQKKPHPDFAAYFDQSDVSSSYYINLAEALRDISPDLVSDLMVEQEDWDIPPRELSEIIREENKLFEIIWYHRYKMRVYRITEEVTASPEIKNKQKEIKKRVLEVAINGAKKIEKKHGKKNLGPWDDFELGMLHGKLSALRWVLGDDFLTNCSWWKRTVPLQISRFLSSRVLFPIRGLCFNLSHCKLFDVL